MTGAFPLRGRSFMPEVDARKPVNSSNRPISRWADWWLRADPRPLLLLAVVLMLDRFWEYGSPEVAMVGIAYIHDFIFGFFALATLAIGRGIQLLLMRFYESQLGVAANAQRSRRRFWVWLIVIAATTYSVTWAGLPMRIGILASRPALDRLADEALADPAKAPQLAGRMVGFYCASGVEVIGDTVVIYLGEDHGAYGFVRAPGARTDVVYNWPNRDMDDPNQFTDFPERDGFRDRTGRRLAGDWFVMYASYWLSKTGWS